jgi:hypothetical protein
LAQVDHGKSEVRGQRSEVRGQRSEVRGQRSEVRGQEEAAAHDASSSNPKSKIQNLSRHSAATPDQESTINPAGSLRTVPFSLQLPKEIQGRALPPGAPANEVPKRCPSQGAAERVRRCQCPAAEPRGDLLHRHLISSIICHTSAQAS